jgi:hypothetical protein
MKNLTSAATERFPEVDFNAASGILTLRGESYPEDASAAFGPLFSWLNGFLGDDKGPAIRFVFDLAYFNSSSAKALMNIFLLLEKAAAAGRRITVEWRYAEGDETMQEFGEDFSEDMEHVEFTLVETK